MARPLRIEFENAFYHITSRGNLRDKIFYDAVDREIFGIKGAAVSDAVKRIEERVDKEAQLRERVEFLKGQILPEF